MVDQLNAFAGEVTGALHGEVAPKAARRPGNVLGVAGTWKDLTDSGETRWRQSDRSGAQHRRGDDGVANGDLSKNHRGRARRNFSS